MRDNSKGKIEDSIKGYREINVTAKVIAPANCRRSGNSQKTRQNTLCVGMTQSEHAAITVTLPKFTMQLRARCQSLRTSLTTTANRDDAHAPCACGSGLEADRCCALDWT